MKIPKRFKLFGRTVTVEDDPRLIDKEDWQGSADFRRSKIILQTHKGDNMNRPHMHKEMSFCHELVHWIYHSMDEQELNHNEKHVEIFSQLLYQTFETMEYK